MYYYCVIIIILSCIIIVGSLFYHVLLLCDHYFIMYYYCKIRFQTCMYSYQVGVEEYILICVFIYIPTLCAPAWKALARMCICKG